ncbi:uncharacterized protein LOC116618061 [Nematostella vectensis]|uniref:uncharacterized protein LOC116618061 n=1 Tax=Nematostella vectensis TaxID=45351 RepID=UPI00207773E5|nr:uncharacterized protein LOC116618061 [Nematostella vectensis]
MAEVASISRARGLLSEIWSRISGFFEDDIDSRATSSSSLSVSSFEGSSQLLPSRQCEKRCLVELPEDINIPEHKDLNSQEDMSDIPRNVELPNTIADEPFNAHVQHPGTTFDTQHIDGVIAKKSHSWAGITEHEFLDLLDLIEHTPEVAEFFSPQFLVRSGKESEDHSNEVHEVGSAMSLGKCTRDRADSGFSEIPSPCSSRCSLFSADSWKSFCQALEDSYTSGTLEDSSYETSVDSMTDIWEEPMAKEDEKSTTKQCKHASFHSVSCCAQ